MVDIFDYYTSAEMPFLEELAEDLEGTFQVIAHAGHEKNLDYIKERQKYFRDKYGRFLNYIISDIGIEHIIPAYDTLQDLLEGDPTPEEIIQLCEECLYENLIVGEPSANYWIFQEFYEQNSDI